MTSKMTSKKILILLGALGLTLVASNCGAPVGLVVPDPAASSAPTDTPADTPSSTPSGAATSSAPSDDPKTVVSAVQQGVQIVGTSFASAALYIDIGRRSSLRDEWPMALTSSLCTSDGKPKITDPTDPNYPGYFTYCAISAGTIKMSFSITSLGACLVNKAGLAYDGAAHVVTVTSSMVSGCSLTGLIAAGAQITLTPSSPAAFNTNYSKGVLVDFTLTSIPMIMKIATNVSGKKQSFFTVQEWTNGQNEASAGSFDSSTGDLWYEYRDERALTSDGWNRHARMHALMTVSGTTPTGTVSLTFANADITLTPGNLHGMLVTESGAFATGLKARYWHSDPVASATEYDTVGNWTEISNSQCYTKTSETATGCGTGLAGFTTNTKFACNTTDSHITVANWGAAITGQTFANVDVDADTQY